MAVPPLRPGASWSGRRCVVRAANEESVPGQASRARRESPRHGRDVKFAASRCNLILGGTMQCLTIVCI